jgi:hypothetical protein
MLSTEDLPLGTSVRKASWVSRLGDIYAIQFLNHDTRNEPFEGSVRVRDRRTVGPLGIHLLEIELPRIKMTFPFSAEQAAGWRAIEWWFYLLKFSDRFQAGEIQKWSGFAIPPGLVSGLKRLVRAEWGRESDYLAELREIEAYQIDLAKRNAAIDAILSASPTRKILRGLLRVLLGIFLSHGSLDRDDVQAVRSPIPEALLKDIWQANRSPNRSADGFEPFLDALRDTGLTII